VEIQPKSQGPYNYFPNGRQPPQRKRISLEGVQTPEQKKLQDRIKESLPPIFKKG